MKQEIINNIENPEKLEELYRDNPIEFSEGFREVYDSVRDFPAADFWQTRLRFDLQTYEKSAGSNSLINESEHQAVPDGRFTLVFTIIASLIAGTLAKLPDIFNFSDKNYIPNNIAFFEFPPY